MIMRERVFPPNNLDFKTESPPPVYTLEDERGTYKSPIQKGK